jgi:hypothetical protein
MHDFMSQQTKSEFLSQLRRQCRRAGRDKRQLITLVTLVTLGKLGLWARHSRAIRTSIPARHPY